MVTFSEFTSFSNQILTQADFTILEQRSVDLLSMLCGSHWVENESTKKAVMYQIEFIIQLGGINAWTEGAGSMQSRSYSVGGESESVTYMQASYDGSGRKVFNGLAIAPMAWAILCRAKLVPRLGRVQTW